MDKNKLVPLISISLIIVSVLISGYILLGPNKQVASQDISGLVPMVDGKQVIQMMVFGTRYDPGNFKVKAGIPVRWEITSSGQPGCASGAVIARGLVDPIYLNPTQGQIAVAEFTPQKPGIYRFSCTMNMVRGTIEVIN